MASGNENFTVRTIARIRQLFGMTSTTDLARPESRQYTNSIHHGMFSNDELRHVDTLSTSPLNQKEIGPQDIITQLADVSSNSRKLMEEVDTLKMMSPEISTAEEVIVSSIMSPVDLQTDSVAVTVDYPIGTDSITKINELLTNYFNDVYHLGPKLYQWLKTAAFHDGAKALMIIPQTSIDVLNTVADSWDPTTRDLILKNKERIASSTEGLCIPDTDKEKEVIDALAATACESLKAINVGSEFFTDDQKKEKFTDAKGEPVSLENLSSEAIAKSLMQESFKILRPLKDGNNGVIVTRDMSPIVNSYSTINSKTQSLQQEAERQIFGYDSKNPDTNRSNFPVLCVSDVIKTNEGDLPIVIELPTDSVIPVCAPGDNKNHLGYFVLVDENGRPVRGEYAFEGTPNNDMTHRLATNAAKSIFGQHNLKTFSAAGMTETQMLDNLNNVFSVAVNYLLKNKLNKDGLKGLNVNIHEAVGKALFYNLLARNQIKMIFVPESMMVYYRLDHREDGTGKSLLEDVRYLLAVRCTLMIAKVMAAIDNATKHRVIEVQVDTKNTNVFEVLERARHMVINKRVPNMSNDPRTAAESIINQHLTIKPKGIPGVVDDLNVNMDSHYGNSQAPDADLLDKINNMIGLGLGVPPSALNNLSDTEYSRSVATVNLFFANKVRNWQSLIRPHNKKFLINYILCNQKLVDAITKIIQEDIDGNDKNTVADNTSDCIKSNQDNEATTIVKKLLSTVELVLAAPNMSTSKAHFEELNSQIEAITKLMETIYPDDIVVDQDLASQMKALRAIASSKMIKQFLPKLGVHEIADVPSIEDIDTDILVKVTQFLGNLKKRGEDIGKLVKLELNKPADGGDTGEPTPDDTPPSGGSDDDMGIPGFEG